MAKKELTISQFREIIREEALKLKKRIVLENEKKALEAELASIMNESFYEESDIMAEEELNELFGSAFKKAKNDFYATHKAEIDQMLQAHKAYDPSYVDQSTQLMNLVKQEYAALAKKYGISMQDAGNVLFKDLMTLVQPTDFNTFNKQSAQGGASFKDVAGGAGAGRTAWTAE